VSSQHGGRYSTAVCMVEVLWRPRTVTLRSDVARRKRSRSSGWGEGACVGCRGVELVGSNGFAARELGKGTTRVLGVLALHRACSEALRGGL